MDTAMESAASTTTAPPTNGKDKSPSADKIYILNPSGLFNNIFFPNDDGTKSSISHVKHKGVDYVCFADIKRIIGYKGNGSSRYPKHNLVMIKTTSGRDMDFVRADYMKQARFRDSDVIDKHAKVAEYVTAELFTPGGVKTDDMSPQEKELKLLRKKLAFYEAMLPKNKKCQYEDAAGNNLIIDLATPDQACFTINMKEAIIINYDAGVDIRDKLAEHFPLLFQ